MFFIDCISGILPLLGVKCLLKWWQEELKWDTISFALCTEALKGHWLTSDLLGPLFLCYIFLNCLKSWVHEYTYVVRFNNFGAIL